MQTISISPSGCDASRSDKPLNRTICWANALICTGSPMSSRNTSPPRASTGPGAPARLPRDRHEVADDFRVGEGDRATSSDLLSEQGTTEPEEPSTLPKHHGKTGVADQRRGLAPPIQPNVWTLPSRWWGERLCRWKSEPLGARQWIRQRGTPEP